MRQISHLSSRAHRPHLATTAAAAVILREADLPHCPTNALVTADPYLAFARISQLWQADERPPSGAHPSACVDPGAEVHPSASIGPNVALGPHTRIGPEVRLEAGVVVGARCRLDAGVRVNANAVLHDDVKIGAWSVIHSGAVIGSEGFGFARDETGAHVPVAQLGGVTLGPRVRVGAATTIDRGALEDTVIEEGVKIDNQVQIGHNCCIGAHTIICGCVGLVGSTVVGRHCVLAGGVGVGGDGPISVCDGVIITGCTHVSRSIDKPGVYSGGVLADTSTSWKRNALRFGELHGLTRRVAELEKALHGRSDA